MKELIREINDRIDAIKLRQQGSRKHMKARVLLEEVRDLVIAEETRIVKEIEREKYVTETFLDPDTCNQHTMILAYDFMIKLVKGE